MFAKRAEIGAHGHIGDRPAYFTVRFVMPDGSTISVEMSPHRLAILNGYIESSLETIGIADPHGFE